MAAKLSALHAGREPCARLKRDLAMSRLRPEKLHVRLAEGYPAEEPVTPRRYTVNHSDTTRDLFLTIWPAFDQVQISGWYTPLVRDEALAEWLSVSP